MSPAKEIILNYILKLERNVDMNRLFLEVDIDTYAY